MLHKLLKQAVDRQTKRQTTITLDVCMRRALIKSHVKYALACERVKLYQLMQDEFGETPLFAACHQGHLETAAMLIKHGAMVNCLNKVRLIEGMVNMW